jgi:transposase
VIDTILEKDQTQPVKQRHTAMRIFRRLQEEYGYTGGRTQVCDYVQQARKRRKEAYVPLAHDPGVAQVDWGEAFVVDQGEQRKVQMFVMTLPFSSARFTAAYPRATLEFFLEGHRRAFEFFGGVPRQIVYDNLKSAVTKVGRGRRRKLNRTFEMFVDYHLIAPRFCNVARGNEKGHVEMGVGWARRNLLTPLPRFVDWEHLNEHLARGCRKYFEHRDRGVEETIGQRLEQESKALLPVPPFPVDESAPRPQEVSSLCLVRFDSNDYSVPCRYAYHPVTVRADVARVRIHHQDQCVGEHVRCHEKEKAIYEPWHYLDLVERKPRTLDDGAPLRQLELDECFEVLRRRMEVGQEHSEGTRAYIRVLQLLKDHSLKKLTGAVRRALELNVEHEEAIKHLLLCPPEYVPSPLDLAGRGHLVVLLPNPDLSAYDVLAKGGVQ